MNKKPWVAFILSFLLPGAGLAYLGKWLWGVVNLVIVLGTGVAVAFFVTDPDIVPAVGAGLGAGSAVLAKTIAAKMKSASAPATPAPASPAPPSRGPATLMEIPSRPARPTTAKCPKCGATTEAANFCVECGAPL